MKTMTKFMFSALCAAAMVTSVSAQGGKDMLSNGIKYLDVPYVAHTLEADGPEELVINCDEVDCTTLVEYVLAETLTGYEAKVEVNDDYSFSLSFWGEKNQLAAIDVAELKTVVEQIKPAHLRFVISGITWADLESVNMTWKYFEDNPTTWAQLESMFCIHAKE